MAQPATLEARRMKVDRVAASRSRRLLRAARCRECRSRSTLAMACAKVSTSVASTARPLIGGYVSPKIELACLRWAARAVNANLPVAKVDGANNAFNCRIARGAFARRPGNRRRLTPPPLPLMLFGNSHAGREAVRLVGGHPARHGFRRTRRSVRPCHVQTRS